MSTRVRSTARLGELIVTVFDKAAAYSTDPLQVSRLATHAIARMLRRGRRAPTVLLSPRPSLFSGYGL